MNRTRLATSAAGLLAALALAVPAGAAPTDKLIGGGSVQDPNLHVSIGASLPCTATDPGAELEINWFNPQPDPPGRESFHLTTIDSAACDANSPSPNDGGMHEGEGTGLCTTKTGSTVPADVQWSLTDSGIDNPNLRRPDMVEVSIRSALPACSLMFSGPLDGGNVRMVDNPNI